MVSNKDSEKISDSDLVTWLNQNSIDKKEIIVKLVLPRRRIDVNQHRRITLPYLQKMQEKRQYTFTQAVENVRKFASEHSVALAAAGAMAMRVSSKELKLIISSPFVQSVHPNHEIKSL